MSKFKEGDSVRLKSGLIIDELYGRYTLVSNMVFSDVRSIVYVGDDDDYNSIEIKGFERYSYTEEMLESAEDPILIPSDCPEPIFFKRPHYSSLACRHKFSPIKFSR